MKIFSLLLFLVMVSLLNIPASAYTDAIPDFDIDTTICATSAFDTLKTTADSSTIVLKWRAKPGWNYYLNYSGITGTGKDSAMIRVVVDAYSFDDSLLYRTEVDSIVDQAKGQAISLPIGSTIFGDKFTVKFIAYNSGTALQAIINRIAIRKERPVMLMRNIGR
jgi:hypothetical protein